MDVDEVATLVADLRSEGSDLAEVEVKRASEGFPQGLASTLSAFANTPGGGTLILGLDESADFAAVGVFDVSQAKSRLASLARQGVQPPVTFDSYDVEFEGSYIVVADIHELPSSGKPCRVASSGKAYLRAYDGDYELSQVEEQAFLANRSTPRFDQAEVGGSSLIDLDDSLVRGYIESCRATSVALARLSDDEVLFRTGVVIGESRTPTMAGLLSLGIYPQQYFPNLVIQASVSPGPSDPPETRAVDQRRFDGPIPMMLDQALRWVQRNTRTRVRFGPDGHGRDEPEYPTQAVRELLANALVHRDLGPHALTEAITLKLEANQLIVSNPGGLWGLTVDRLGKVGVTSARNGWVVRICQNVRWNRDQRVVEALASGIPTVLASLESAGMVAPRFHDQGIRFAVRVPNHTLLAAEDLDWLSRLPSHLALSDTQRHALVAMRHGAEWTNKSFREAFPMDSRESRKLLQDLVSQGVAEAEGERGGRVYFLASAFKPAAAAMDGQEPLWGYFSGEGTPAAAAPPPPSSAVSVTDVRPQRARNAELLATLLQTGPAGVSDLMARSSLSERQVKYALQGLREEGQVQLVGGPGHRDSRYALVSARPFGTREEPSTSKDESPEPKGSPRSEG